MLQLLSFLMGSLEKVKHSEPGAYSRSGSRVRSSSSSSSQSVSQSVSQPVSQSVSRSVNQSVSQSATHTTTSPSSEKEKPGGPSLGFGLLTTSLRLLTAANYY